MKLDEKLLQLAQAFENTTLSRKDAVNKFGTEAQKRIIEKNGRFKDKAQEAPFLKTLNQLFDSVDYVKVGRRKDYKLGNARQKIAKREDKRENNGGQESDYTKYLDALVLMAMHNGVFHNSVATLSNWVINFGLANHTFYALKNNLSSDNPTLDANTLREGLLKDRLINTAKINTAEINQLIQDFQAKERKLDAVLKKMKKDNLINYYEVPMVKIKYPVEIDDDGNKTVIKPESAPYVTEIDTKAEKSITEKQAELREKYKLTQFNVFTVELLTEDEVEELEKDPDFKEDNLSYRVYQYHQDLMDFYMNDVIVTDTQGNESHLPIEYFWFSHAITVKATKTRIKNYIKKNRPEFYEEFINDSELFFSEAKDYYLECRRKELVQKAYRKAEKEKAKIEERNKNSFGMWDIKSRKAMAYWSGQFEERVCAIDDKFPPDLEQGIKYLR